VDELSTGEDRAYNAGPGKFRLLEAAVQRPFDWYTKNTSDLIFTVPVCASCNLSNLLTTNIGSMRNRGFDVTLNAPRSRARDPAGLDCCVHCQPQQQ